jgi:hypothetical protein
MEKIPVLRTVGRAYAFAFGRFFGNLGVVWIPELLLMAAGGFLAVTMMENWAAALPHLTNNPADVETAMRGVLQAYRLVILFWLVGILLRAQIMLGLTRRALELSEGPSLVFLSLGRDFWRLAGAYFAVMVILYAVELVLMIVLVVAAVVTGVTAGIAANAAGASHAALAPVAGLAFVAVFAVVFGALIYIAVRLTFLLTPAIAAEHRFDLTGPWQMTAGNFWRIFAIGVAVFIPVFILIGAIEVPALIFVVMPVLHIPQVAAHDPKAVQLALDGVMGAWRTVVFERWYVLVPLVLLSATLIYGVAAGAAAAAWEALATKREGTGTLRPFH